MSGSKRRKHGIAGRAAIVALALIAGAWGKKHGKRVDQSLASEMVTMLARGNYQGVVLHFNKDLQREEPPAKLQLLWKAVLNEYGSYKKQLGLDTEDVPGYDIINVHCAFKYAPVIVRFVFTAHSRVGNLFIVPDTKKKADAAT